MNRRGLWVIGLGAVLGVAFLCAPYGFAGDRDDRKVECTLNTLEGQYLEAGSGMLFPPAFGVTAPSVSTVAAYSVYNGDGTGEDHVTFSVNGIDLHVPSPTPFVYTLNPDCTGTRTANSNLSTPGPHFDIFVASNGEALTEIATDPGFAVATLDRRVGR